MGYNLNTGQGCSVLFSADIAAGEDIGY